MTEALIGWLVEETTLEAVGMKNCLLVSMFALCRLERESWEAQNDEKERVRVVTDLQSTPMPQQCWEALVWGRLSF